VRHHAQHDAGFGRGAVHLKHAKGLAVVHQRQALRAGGHRRQLVEARHPGTAAHAATTPDPHEGRRIRLVHPERHGLGRQLGAQGLGHRGDGLLLRRSGVESLRDRADNGEAAPGE
jgi:hypothetical protein